MDSEKLFDALIEAEIIDLIDDGETVRLSPTFQKVVEETTIGDQPQDLPEEMDVLSSVFDEETPGSEGARELYRRFVALREFLPDIPYDQALRATIVLDQLEYEPPSVDGVPEAFFPVSGDRLSALVRLSERAVVYVWLEDCDPCDDMRNTFDELFETAPDDIGLYAVYGPECAEQLQNEYDIVGGPTTLFVLDGTVDARIVGSHHPSSVKNEIEILRG